MDASISTLLSLDGKVALVTGGATGIGEGIARTLAAAGARVVIADLNLPGAEAVAESIGGHAVETDVADPASAARAVDATVAWGGSIDILVNNAGSYASSGSILDQSREDWGRMIAINLESVFNCSQPAARRMVGRGQGGAIVNISSVDGILPCLGTGYDSAKAGVLHFTKSLAIDLAPHGIRANAIAPGWIQVETLLKMRSGELPPVYTPKSETGLMGPLMRQRSANIPLGRPGQPDDIANATLFLVSGASTYITGQTIAVDGGWLLL